MEEKILKYKHTNDELQMFQNMDLDLKIAKTKIRIQEWYEHWNGSVYISFSGGKDSTVLADLAAQICVNLGNKLILVFSDTGLEYPEIKEFVVKYPEYLKNKYKIEVELVVVKPSMSFREVILNEGYPIASKKIARMIRDCQNPTENNKASRNLYLTGVKRDGTISKSFKLSKRWIPMIDSKWKVSEKCCDIMKKDPIKNYQKETKMKPIIGTMACESDSRKISWLSSGCNAFNSKNPSSQPISFWTEQDVLKYLKIFEIPYASVYGEILEITEQKDDINILKYSTSGVNRTGCVFCMFGCHLEKSPNRFEQMNSSHPKLYNYCMKSIEAGGLGLDEILTFNKIKH